MIITGSLDITPVVDGTNGKDAVAYQMNATPATVEFNGAEESLVTSSVAISVQKIVGDAYTPFSGTIDVHVKSGTKVLEKSVVNGAATINLQTERLGRAFYISDFPLSLRLRASASSTILQRLEIPASDINTKGPKGDKGNNAVVYSVIASAIQISVRKDGSCVPATVDVYANVTDGHSAPTLYEGGELWRITRSATGEESSSMLDRSAGIYQIPSSTLQYMALFAKAGGTFTFELRQNATVLASMSMQFSFDGAAGDPGPAGPKTVCRGLYDNSASYEFSGEYVDWVIKNFTAVGGSVSEQAYIRKRSGSATAVCQGIEPGVTQGWQNYWQAIDSNEAAYFRSLLVAFISARDGAFDHLSAVDVDITGTLNATTGKFQNVFVNGCINNLITVIDTDNNIGNDLILTDEYSDHHLDVLRCGDFIWIKSLPRQMWYGGTYKFIHLPWFIDDATNWRGRTKYLTNVEHSMTSNEMRQLVGRKITIMVEPSYVNTFLSGISAADPYGNQAEAIRRITNGQYVLNKSTIRTLDNDYRLTPRMFHIECHHVVLVDPSTQAASNAYLWLGQSDYLASNDDLLDWD